MSEQILSLVGQLSKLTPLTGKLDSVMQIVNHKESSPEERLMALGQFLKVGMSKSPFVKQNGMSSFITCIHCNAMELIDVNTSPRLDFGPMDLLTLMKLSTAAKGLNLGPIRELFAGSLNAVGVDPKAIKSPVDAFEAFQKLSAAHQGQFKLRLYQALTSGKGVYDHTCTECGGITTFNF